MLHCSDPTADKLFPAAQFGAGSGSPVALPIYGEDATNEQSRMVQGELWLASPALTVKAPVAKCARRCLRVMNQLRCQNMQPSKPMCRQGTFG